MLSAVSIQILSHAQRLRAAKPLSLFQPLDLAQNDLRLAASFFDGFLPVTAVLSFDPGFSLLYLATPALVIPAPDFVDLKYFLVLGGCLSLFLITLV